MPDFLEILRRRKVILSDGAMGTMLFERGLKPGDCPERMNLEDPAMLEEIANLYLRAGAEIIQTNTFGASPLKLKPHDLDDRTEKITISAVKIAKRAAKEKAFVAASCGPCGSLLKPYGDTEPEEIREGFERQIRAQISAGADIIAIETMTDLIEAELAVKAAKAVSSSIPVSACMTFDSTPKGFFTIMGVTISQAATRLADAGADIIGSNCGNGIENMIRVAEEFKRVSNLPILIRSNAGFSR